MNDFRMVEHIVCVDGVDGSGKGTVTKMIKERYEAEGHQVALIEPPFYHTRPGQIVKSYLTKGYADFKDRSMASMLYSFDRNMYWYKHFEEVFNSGKYDVVLFDRNWLSNVFFQTTMICQTPEDTKKFLGRKITPGYYHHSSNFTYTLPELHDWIMSYHPNDPQVALCDEELHKLLGGEITADQKDVCQYYRQKYYDAYRGYRCQMVRNMIDFVHRLEIMPWSDYKAGIMLPFGVQGVKVKNVVLTPEANPEHLQFIYSNLMKRYEGDISKMDRNEASAKYLLAVIENIHWIRQHFDEIMSHHYINTDCRHMSPNETDLFRYEIVHTNNVEPGTQRPIEAVAADVYDLLDVQPYR